LAGLVELECATGISLGPSSASMAFVVIIGKVMLVEVMIKRAYGGAYERTIRILRVK